MLTKTDEDKILDIVVQAIKDVVIPALDDLATKDGLNKIDIRLTHVENRLEQVDRKLDIMTAKVYTHDNQIKKLEQLAA